MATIKFGMACDTPGCRAIYNDYDVGDILTCRDCGKDLCLPCREKTGHRQVGEVCCQECPGPYARCEARTGKVPRVNYRRRS